MKKQESYKEEQEVSQYEKLADRTRELLETTREKTPKTVEEALEKEGIAENLPEMSHHSSEQSLPLVEGL